jgi:predicted kinase
MLIVMAGLPGTGKTALAERIAERLDAVLLNKDAIRARLFDVVEYNREQDDAVLATMYEQARSHIARGRAVIIDGRTFSRAYQLRDLFAAAAAMGESPWIIECIAANDVVKERLDRDAAAGTHPAGNRNFALYQEVKRRADPLTVPRLTLDTGSLSLDDCLTRALVWLNESSPSV